MVSVPCMPNTQLWLWSVWCFLYAQYTALIIVVMMFPVCPIHSTGYDQFVIPCIPKTKSTAFVDSIVLWVQGSAIYICSYPVHSASFFSDYFQALQTCVINMTFTCYEFCFTLIWLSLLIGHWTSCDLLTCFICREHFSTNMSEWWNRKGWLPWKLLWLSCWWGWRLTVQILRDPDLQYRH